MNVRIGLVRRCRHGHWLAHRRWYGKLCWPNFMVSDRDHHVLYEFEGRGASVEYTSDDLIKEFEKYADWPVVPGRVRVRAHEQTRSVMGQDDDGTPNGEDYTETRSCPSGC